MNFVRLLSMPSSFARRYYAKKLGPIKNKFSNTSKSTSSTTSEVSETNFSNVVGLSSRCVETTTGPVGPGAKTDGDYKVPEYFCFNQYTFTEAEIEMAKYRVPQPSALKTE